MKTFYLIDFENVHNDGIANIESITKEEHVHIFSTQNATNIRRDIFWLNGDIKSHLVPVRKQSSDMHLVSYLGHLLGVYGKECSYVIISKDKDYDNIVKFWKEEGYPNISRKEKLPGTASTQRQKTQTVSQTKSNVQTVNSKISAGISSRNSSMPIGSNPFVGSSNIKSSGSPSNAIAMPSLCFIPKENAHGR